MRFIKGTAPLMGDLHDVLEIVSSRCPNIFYLAAGLIVDSEARSVPYVLSTGGQVFSTTLQTVQISPCHESGYVYSIRRWYVRPHATC